MSLLFLGNWHPRNTFLIPLLLLIPLTSCHAKDIHLSQIKLPPGFAIKVFAGDVPGARALALGAKGTVFVGTRDEGKVYAIRNAGSPRAEVITLAKGLNMPNGVAFRDGALYVAEIHRVIRFDDIEDHLNSPPKPVLVNGSFPHEKHHGWKFIRFGPDGKLYVPVGAPCNACDSKDQRFASIMRMAPDGKGLEIFARGVRNTVGFDWHPTSHELWFTDNGRDLLGDDTPPDELNRAAAPGLHFGFPYWHGRDTPDPQFGGKMRKGEFVPPEIELPAHVASLLACVFIPAPCFPLSTATRSSSQNTAPGTGASRPAIGFPWSASRVTRPFPTRCLPRGGFPEETHGDAPSICKSCRTEASWFPTTGRAPSTASATGNSAKYDVHL
jgi:hypothetical protein